VLPLTTSAVNGCEPLYSGVDHIPSNCFSSDFVADAVSSHQIYNTCRNLGVDKLDRKLNITETFSKHSNLRTELPAETLKEQTTDGGCVTYDRYVILLMSFCVFSLLSICDTCFGTKVQLLKLHFFTLYEQYCHEVQYERKVKIDSVIIKSMKSIIHNTRCLVLHDITSESGVCNGNFAGLCDFLYVTLLHYSTLCKHVIRMLSPLRLSA